MYQMAAFYSQLHAEGGEQTYLQAAQDIKKAMRTLSKKWAAACMIPYSLMVDLLLMRRQANT
jgi:hypothetical protein